MFYEQVSKLNHRMSHQKCTNVMSNFPQMRKKNHVDDGDKVTNFPSYTFEHILL